MFKAKAEAEANFLASGPFWPGGLNISVQMPPTRTVFSPDKKSTRPYRDEGTYRPMYIVGH